MRDRGNSKPSEEEVLDALGACCRATYMSASWQRAKDDRHEDRCYRRLLRLLFGRRPTKADLDRIYGTGEE